MPKRESLRRRTPFRKVLPRILIICEGTKTEPGYFQDFRYRYRRAVEVDLVSGGVPRTLVARAVEMRQNADRAAGKDENERYDEVWCVFDIDDHPQVDDAKQQARDNEIKLAISNPCFELWVLLHFQDQRAHISRGKLRTECRKHLPAYEKEIPTETLGPLHDQAVTRARDLDAWQREQGRQGANPSTGVYKLTQTIRGFEGA
jgi:RloB-like protein